MTRQFEIDNAFHFFKSDLATMKLEHKISLDSIYKMEQTFGKKIDRKNDQRKDWLDYKKEIIAMCRQTEATATKSVFDHRDQFKINKRFFDDQTHIEAKVFELQAAVKKLN